VSEQKNSYTFEDLIECAKGHLFGPGNAQLPLPPMLMFDRIVKISDTGGKSIGRKMFEDIDFNLTPVIAAASAVLVAISLALMGAAHLLTSSKSWR